jgi:hypothetical protein
MITTSSRGLFFKAKAFDFKEAIMITVSDASWANDDKIVESEGQVKIFPKRSQYGRIQLLGDPKLWSEDEGYVHFLGFKSGLIKRTCRSTMRAETHGMLYATETADNLRAVISCLRNQFESKDWEYNVRRQLRNVWMTDCQSLYDYLVNPIPSSCEDKRLEIDLQGLRESLWERADGSIKDEITDDQTDKPRWIDTSVMICDSLTKFGNDAFAQRLVDTMETGILNLQATASSQLKKMRQQKARMNRILTES